jgi:microcystin-dependent protein
MAGLSGAIVGELKMWAGGGTGSAVTVTLNGDPGSAVLEPKTGWLLCNGAVITLGTYPALVSELGTAYNQPGDSLPAGSVRLPNLQQKFPLGRAASGVYSQIGLRGGAMDHIHDLGSHYHGMSHTHDMRSHTHQSPSHTHGMSHKHYMDHYHTVNIASGAPSTPYVGAADAAGGPGWTVPTASHIHIVTGNASPVVGGSNFTGSEQNYTDFSTRDTTDGTTFFTGAPSTNTTSSPSTLITLPPNTNNSGSASTEPAFQIIHYLIKY